MSHAHPFLADDFLIQWSALTPEHIAPDVTKAIETSRENINAIKSVPPTEATYENTFGALEKATDQLDHSWGLVNHLDSVKNSEALREALNEMLPAVSEFSSSICLDSELWQVLKAYAESDDVKQLSPIKQRLVDEVCANFRKEGADLEADAKARMFEINALLAKVTQKFGENVLDSTNAWELYISDEKRLKGIPENDKTIAFEDARSKGKTGQWRFTQQFPSMYPVMQHAEDDSLRKEVWEGSTTIGNQGEQDNTALVWEILTLRQEKAELLGFKHFPDYVLQKRMAKDGETAHSFVQQLHDRIKERFDQEAKDLRAYKAKITQEPETPLEPWEMAYWAEKLRKDLYNFDDEAMRPYFPVDDVMKGLFDLTSKLFNIRIKEAESETWHEEVKYYDLHDAVSGEHLGSFYADWHPRESKRGGAWMNQLKTGTPSPRTPHLGLIVGNMTKPTGSSPALLTHREVETIFHEFGHLLHLLLSDVEIESLAGTNVPWDFVELPSQIMENFCWDRESLDFFARHYETGEVIPEELFEKMVAARNFRSATGFMRQLAMGKIDLALHLEPSKYEGQDLDELERQILATYRTDSATEPPSVTRRFNHLFSSPIGYASGYYSYKWAEVLDADAFTRFRKEGVLNTETGQSFRKEVLSVGNSRPVDESFRAFMGRDPEQTALLERSGLA